MDIAAVGTTFNPPIEITYPNMSGLPGGSVAYFLSFNHATSRFEIVATGHVTNDGSQIISDPGAGLTVASWGCNCPPYSVAGDCDFDPCDGDVDCCLDRCCQESDCCDNPDPCCDQADPCCGNPDRCCNGDNPCCGNPDPCCNPNGPCCDNSGPVPVPSSDRCCNPDNPCCGSDDPCCNLNDPCCGSDDPCCNDDNPCCVAAVTADAFAPAPTGDDESAASLTFLAAASPCCDNPEDPCCNNPDPCCRCTGMCCGDHCCEVMCCAAGCCDAGQTCCGGTECCAPENCCENGVCCSDVCDKCLDYGTLSGGMITVDRDPVCVGDTITFTLSGVVDSGGMKQVNCTEHVSIPPVTPICKWTVTKPDGIVKGSTSGPTCKVTILATAPGTYSIVFTITADRECPPSSITRGPKMAKAIEADLDVDSDNNNGTSQPDRTLTEDLAETTPPGKLLCVNDDDDDSNGTPDHMQEPPPAGDDDLIPMVAELKNSAPSTSRWQLVYDPAVVQVYKSDRATIVPTGQVFPMPLSPNPKTFWIEGLAPTIGGPTTITFNVDLDGDGIFDCADSVFVSVVQVDLDVDSDNSNTAPDFVPQRTMTEDAVEDDPTKPGRIIWANNNDDDRDNVADFGDGFNLDAMAVNDDDANAAEIGFVRMVFEITVALDSTNATVQVSYSASDPAAAVTSAAPPGIVPAPGNLRIWTKNGNQTRNAGVIPMGDFVSPGTYAPSDLGLSGTVRTVNLWLEGIAPSTSSGADRIVFSVDPDGAGPAPSCVDAVRVTISQLEVLDSMMMLTDHVDIGHWGDDRGTNELSGYTTGLNGTVMNSAGGTFIDADPDRFVVRLTHHPANMNPAVVEMFVVQVGTLTKTGAVDDADHNITLLETGPDTGVFLSESQLMTAPDLSMVAASDQDDGFAVYSTRTMTTVADEADNDRTHKATIDGHLKATYAGLGGNCDLTAPVCDRVPMDERKEVRIRVHVFNEPFEDVGFDHDGNPATPPIGAGNGIFDFNDTNGNGMHDAGEASEPWTDISPDGARNTVLGSTSNATGHVAAQIERANQAWAQACITVMQVGSVAFDEAPANTSGVNIFQDADFDTNLDEETVILNTVGTTHDVLEVFFVAPIVGPPANALANTPALRGAVTVPPGQEENSYVFLGLTSLNMLLDARFRTLAHELGHALTNQGDMSNTQYIYFPAVTTFDDAVVNTYRRIRHGTEITARLCRHAGNLTDPGNRLVSGCR